MENIKIDQDLFSSFKSLKTSLPSYSDEAFKLFFSQLKKPREPANLNGELLSGKPLNLNFSNFCIKVKLIFPQVSPTLETFKTFFSFISSKKEMSINKIYAEETIRDFFNNLNSFNNLCLKFIEFCSKSKKPAIFDRNTHFIPLWNFPNKSNKIPYSDLSILYNTLRDFKIENYKKDNTAPPKTQIPKNQHSSKPTPPKIPIPPNITLCPFHECFGEKAKNCLKGCHFFSDRASALSSSFPPLKPNTLFSTLLSSWYSKPEISPIDLNSLNPEQVSLFWSSFNLSKLIIKKPNFTISQFFNFFTMFLICPLSKTDFPHLLIPSLFLSIISKIEIPLTNNPPIDIEFLNSIDKISDLKISSSQIGRAHV